MINLIKVPQRADVQIVHTINNDILTIKIDEIEETFDFTGLNEGIAEEIIVENLPLNPILKAEKIGDTINIEVLRFYSFEEKELFENGYN